MQRSMVMPKWMIWCFRGVGPGWLFEEVWLPSRLGRRSAPRPW
jgi:hypothetical protein